MIPCRSIWVHINGKSTMDNNSNNNIFPASIIISDNNSRWSMALPLWRIVFRTSAITALLPDSSAVTFRDTPVSFLFLPPLHPPMDFSIPLTAVDQEKDPSRYSLLRKRRKKEEKERGGGARDSPRLIRDSSIHQSVPWLDATESINSTTGSRHQPVHHDQ